MKSVHWQSTGCGQCSALCVVSLAGLAISRQRFQGQIRFDRATGETTFCREKGRNHYDDVLLKSLFCRDLLRYENLYISQILHAIRVC